MSSKNPYDGYDAYDPWEDDDVDGSGNFSFVEDEYDATEDPFGDGFVSVPSERGGTQSFPRTEYRPMVSDVRDSPDYPDEAYPGPVLKRRKRARRQEAEAFDYVDSVPSPPQTQAPVPARPPRRRRRHHFGCLFTLLLVAAIVGAYWVVARPIDERLAFSSAEQATLDGKLSWHFPSTPSYILALGSDAREGETFSRTDTMMLIRVDFWGGKLTMLSIPRDTMVEIAGQGTQKINAAYAFGGAGGAVQAVSQLCGVPVNHVAVVHFEELAGLVDYLGGVTVNVPVDVYDPDYTGLVLNSGLQTLDGETALLWARVRHGFESGDYQRQEDQRLLLTAIMNRALSLSPEQFPGLVQQLGDLIGTDMRCYNLVPLLLRFKLVSPVVYSATVPSSTATIDGISYVIADDAALVRMMQVINAGGDPSTVA